jgi:hypothetical protein
MYNWPGTGNKGTILYKVNFLVSSISQPLQFDFSADAGHLHSGFSLATVSTAGFSIEVADYLDSSAQALVSGTITDRAGNKLLVDTLAYYASAPQTTADEKKVDAQGNYGLALGLASFD